jgi:hypothetical protein
VLPEPWCGPVPRILRLVVNSSVVTIRDMVSALFVISVFLFSSLKHRYN